MRSSEPSVTRGIATGLIAGISATLIMDQFFKLVGSSQKSTEKKHMLAEGKSREQADQELQQKEQQAAEQEDSTEIVARKIAGTAGKSLDKDEKKKAGQVVHYAFGTLMGVVYCVTSEILPEATAGGGAGFGTLLFLGADEVAVPALRLAPQPAETAAPFDHLQHWAAHIVYGGSLELIRSIIRRLTK